MIPFLAAFLAVCFFLILIQRDLSYLQKSSLLLNPALVALILLIYTKEVENDARSAADIVPVMNECVRLLHKCGSPEAKKAASVIDVHTEEAKSNKTRINWQKLASELKSIREPATSVPVAQNNKDGSSIQMEKHE